MRSMTQVTALVLLACAGPALAQATDTDTADVAINGTVTPLCVLGEPSQAMIDLGQQYIEAGFFLDSTELPDFVPVFLEFASCLPPDEARDMLGQPAHVYAALAERLGKRQSPYAAIFHALVALAGVRPDAEAVAEVDANTPSVDPAAIDEEWEEAPVSFNLGGAHEMGGPTGFVAKVRASNRAGNREAGQ